MAGTFPNLASGQVAMYPVEMERLASTGILRFADDTEQRWATNRMLHAFTLQYERIAAADLATLKGFFDTQKGGFDKTWVFPFNGTNYSAMRFEQDDFTIIEASPNRYNVGLKIRQVASPTVYSSATAVFPAIATGIVTQLPYTSSFRYRSILSEMPSGQVYTHAARAGALGLWTLTFEAILNSELNTLMDFFCAMHGPFSQFSFTDPRTGTTHTKCRFAQQMIQARYVSANVRSTQIQIEEYA